LSGSSRPPVDAPARREALDRAFAELARTMTQLETAVSVFAPGFNAKVFEGAWHSDDAEERNRAMLVRSNMDDLHNLCNSLIALAVRVAQDQGAIPSDRTTPAADQLQAQGLYPVEARRVMRAVAKLRNVSQHEYRVLEPVDVYEAVNCQRQHLPAFITALGDWIERLRPL
jgi:uncharacterized protein YutE (UPF0331/DUF86 family)